MTTIQATPPALLDKFNPNSTLVKATLLATSMLTVMAGAIVAPSLPAMQATFAGVDNVELLTRLVLTMPALFIVIGAPAIGLMIDRFGRKPLLIVSAILYGLAGSSGYILSSLYGILVGRALLGLAVAGIMTTITTLIADYYSGTVRAQFLGLQAAFMGIGGATFLTAGGFIADLNWRNPFLIYLFVFALLPFVLFSLSEPRRDSVDEERPYPSASSGDCVAEAERCREDKSKQLEPATIEQTTNNGGLPIKLMVLIYSVMVLLQIIFYLVPVQLPFYLQSLLSANAAQSGFAISMMTLLFATGSILSARISKHVDHIPMIALSFVIIGLGYSVMGLVGSYILILVGLAIGGLGFGFLIPNLNVWLASEAPEKVRGRVLGGLTTAVFLGQFLSPIVTQPLINLVDIGPTYLMVGVGLIVLAILVFFRNNYSTAH